jgi:hypothetical protein
VRWVQAEGVFARIRDALSGGVERAEEALGRILEAVGGKTEDTGHKLRSEL